MLFLSATAAALLLASQTLAANVITITQYPSVCSAVYTTGSKSFTVVQSTITVQPVPYNDTAYNTAQVPFVIETTPEGSTVRSWLTYDGSTTTNASLAGQYVIRNGGLYTLTGGQISGSPGAGVQSFAPSSTVGPISTGFAFTNGVLSWTNAAFPTGSIGFYSNGRTVIFSTNGNVPPGYVKVVVRAVFKSSIDGVASATGLMSVSTSIIAGSMSSASPPAGYSSPKYAGPISSSAPPFVYAPTASPSPSVSSAGQPPIHASVISSSSAAAVVPPPAYSSPAVTSVSTSPAPIISASRSASASSSPKPSSSAVASSPAASPTSTPKASSSVPPTGLPGGYSLPAAASSSSPSAAASSSAGLQLTTQNYQNTPIGPNNPIVSTAVSSSAAASSSSASSSASTVLSVYTPSLASEPPLYIPTPNFSTLPISSSAVVPSPSISLTVYSLQPPPIGPNNPTIASSSASSGSSAASSSLAQPSLPNPYSSPSAIFPVTLPSSSSVVIPTVLSSVLPPVSATPLGSSSAPGKPSEYSSPAVVLTSSSSSAAQVNPPAYSSPSAAASSSSSSRASSYSAHSSSSSAQAPIVTNTTTMTSTSSSASSTAPISSAVPSCPTGDETTFFDANGAVYTLYCNVESQRVSYSNSPAGGLQACMTLCDLDAKCVAATYAGPASDGVCYLKSTTGPFVSSPVQYLVKRSGPTNGIAASSSSVVSSSSSSQAAPSVYGQATTITTTTAVSSSSSSSSSTAVAPAPPLTTVTTTTSITSTTRTTTTTSTRTTSTTTTTTSTSASPYLILPSPTPCDFDDPPGYPEDDSYCSVDLPFTIQIYGSSARTAYASTNGYISILAGSSQYQVQAFPDTAIPNNTVAPYFDDLYVYDNAYPAQGIWYQIQGSAVVWEYYLGRAGGKGSIYHFTVAYDSTLPGTFRFKYYSVGTDSADKGTDGLYAGVGIQGLTDSGSQYKQYSYQEAGSIKSGMMITCSSSAGTCTAGSTSLITISIG